MTGLLKRTTFIVADMDRMRAFYCGVFGMRPWYDHDLAVDARFPPTGQPDGAPASLVILQATDPTVGMLGLLCYHDDKFFSLPRPPRDLLGIGSMVLVWNVDDVDRVAVAIETYGGRIATAPTIWTVPAREGGPATRLKMLAAFDPEGHYLEVSQRM